MAKAKYRIGDLLKFRLGDDELDTKGEVEAVVHHKSGVSYVIEGQDQHIKESDIAAHFREVKPRQQSATPRKAKAGKSAAATKPAKATKGKASSQAEIPLAQ